MSPQRGVFVLLAALATFPSVAAGQGGGTRSSSGADQRPHATWISLSALGPTTFGGTSAALALSFQNGHRVLSTRLALGARSGCEGSDFFHSTDIAVVVAYAAQPRQRLRVSAGTGLGYATYTDARCVNLRGVALPLEFQLSWLATRFVGVGLYAWGNTVGPQGGVGVALQVGRLR